MKKKILIITLFVITLTILITIYLNIDNIFQNKNLPKDEILTVKKEVKEKKDDSSLDVISEPIVEKESKSYESELESNESNEIESNNTETSSVEVPTTLPKEDQTVIINSNDNQQPTNSTNYNQVIEPTPTCTPKKFDMSYVRPDFESFAECDSKGLEYKAIGYGYFCDDYQDDCGTTYYMLSLYQRNSNVEYDFHTIPLP